MRRKDEEFSLSLFLVQPVDFFIQFLVYTHFLFDSIISLINSMNCSAFNVIEESVSEIKRGNSFHSFHRMHGAHFVKHSERVSNCSELEVQMGYPYDINFLALHDMI